MHLFFMLDALFIVSFLNILAQKEQYFLEMWNLRLVLFSKLYRINRRLLQRACVSRNWAYTSSHANGKSSCTPPQKCLILVHQEVLNWWYERFCTCSLTLYSIWDWISGVQPTELPWSTSSGFCEYSQSLSTPFCVYSLIKDMFHILSLWETMFGDL